MFRTRKEIDYVTIKNGQKKGKNKENCCKNVLRFMQEVRVKLPF